MDGEHAIFKINCDFDPDSTGRSNHKKISEYCLNQCPSDFDSTGELAIIEFKYIIKNLY